MIKRGRLKSKKAQSLFGLQFSVIFSIFLIIFFIIIAFIVIKHFFGLRECVKIGLFIEDLKEDVDTAWGSQKFSSEYSYSLPKNIEYVCFANLSKSVIFENDIEKKIIDDLMIYRRAPVNLFLYPRENACDIPYYYLRRIDTNRIISSKNPFCIPTDNGIINLKIEKEFNDGLVKLS